MWCKTIGIFYLQNLCSKEQMWERATTKQQQSNNGNKATMPNFSNKWVLNEWSYVHIDWCGFLLQFIILKCNLLLSGQSNEIFWKYGSILPKLQQKYWEMEIKHHGE